MSKPVKAGLFTGLATGATTYGLLYLTKKYLSQYLPGRVVQLLHSSFYRPTLLSLFSGAVAGSLAGYLKSPYSQHTMPPAKIAEEAIAHTDQELANQPHIAPYYGKTDPNLQGNREKIFQLTSLYWNKVKEWKDLIRNGGAQRQEITKIAYTCLQIGYVISSLTLEEALKSDNPEETLTRQDKTCSHKTYFCLSLAYHNFRAELFMFKNGKKAPDIYRRFSGNHEKDIRIRKEHIDLFCKGDNTYSKGRALYNYFCDTVNQKISFKKLRKHDKRFTSWTVRDSHPRNFKSTPDMTPS